MQLVNLPHRSALEASSDVLEVLRFFETPHTRKEFEASYDIDGAVLDTLLRESMLVDASTLPLVRDGLLTRAVTPVGAPLSLHELSPRRGAAKTFALLGVPTDQGSTAEAGARVGPTAIRAVLTGLEVDDTGALPAAYLDIDARRRYRTEGRRLLDVGDVLRVPREGVEAMGAKVEHATATLFAAGVTPILLGGDHALSLYGIRAAVARFGRIGVLHFDAHHDLSLGEAGVDHANVFRHVLALKEVCALRQIGLRTLEPAPSFLNARRDARLSWVTARELRAMRRVTTALRGLSRTLPYYLSFDIDCLDPSVAPETGSPVAGGLALHHALDLVGHACRTLRIVGADFVEVAGPATGRNLAAAAAARLVAQVIVGDAPSSRLAPSFLVP